jgi:hypothetical protein
MHFLLRRAALCLDCESCFELGRDHCPACGGDTWVPLARFLELGKDDAGVAASERRFLSRSLDAVVEEPDPRHLTLGEGLSRAVATAPAVDIAEVKVAVPVRHEGRPAHPADHHPLLRKTVAVGLVLVALGGVIVIGEASRRALREHPAPPKSALAPPEVAPRPSLVSHPPAPPPHAAPAQPAPPRTIPTSVSNQPTAPPALDVRPPQPLPPKVASKPVAPARNGPRPAMTKTSPPRPEVTNEPKRDGGGGGTTASSLREFLKSVSPRDLGGKE